uniref:Uncharacterized protein n=1 Tax=Anguilla anguilla TaxID=7936 RepID=A0A0E9T3I7_ANGAN
MNYKVEKKQTENRTEKKTYHPLWCLSVIIMQRDSWQGGEVAIESSHCIPGHILTLLLSN